MRGSCNKKNFLIELAPAVLNSTGGKRNLLKGEPLGKDISHVVNHERNV